MHIMNRKLKFLYSEKAPKFCEIFPLLLSYAVPVKSKGNFLAFSEYVNFTYLHSRSDKMECNDSEIRFFFHPLLTSNFDKLFGDCYARIRVTSLLDPELAESNAYPRKSTIIFTHFKY